MSDFFTGFITGFGLGLLLFSLTWLLVDFYVEKTHDRYMRKLAEKRKKKIEKRKKRINPLVVELKKRLGD